jgi:hypothetical protein
MSEQKLKGFHPTDNLPLYFTEIDFPKMATFYSSTNMCKIASQIVVGGENWILMMAL